MKNSIFEVWMTPIAELKLVTWNECGCCENSVNHYSGHAHTRTNTSYGASYGGQNKSAWTKRLKAQGWTRLTRDVETRESRRAVKSHGLLNLQ